MTNPTFEAEFQALQGAAPRIALLPLNAIFLAIYGLEQTTKFGKA
jgi:hypothetical protein